LLQRSGFKDDASFRKLKSVLTISDLVKFAKYSPEPSENDQQFENGWDFVSLTRSEELPQVEPAEAGQERREEA
jgi:hypothetical protein